MKTSTQILPGVKAIGWIDCRLLPRRIDLAAICGMPVAILTDIHPVEFFDQPQCECTTQKDGAGYHDTASLKFLSGSLLPDNGRLAFIVTDVGGRSFVIGSREKPHPVIAVTRRCGSPQGDPAGYEYEITHTAIKSLVPCLT